MSCLTITSVDCVDVRFPTSLELDGSDAMHKRPDYSAAYVTIHTDSKYKGNGIGFTLGRGTELVVSAVKMLSHLVVGCKTSDIFNDFAAFWRKLVHEDQIRWLGPEKGVTHLATAAIINAIWDLWAKMEEKPLWKLLVDMSPEQLVSTIDFSYITDVITKNEALTLLKSRQVTAQERARLLKSRGYPAYITSAGWLGYSDDKIRDKCRVALKEGFTSFKMKVGTSLEDDIKRSVLIREEIGYECNLMMDANQRWDVEEAVDHMKKLAFSKPLWIEEPTSPDDVLGHARIARELKEDGIGVATGEACQNKVIFKQLMQANAISFCQIDSCRVGGVNENLAIILMANKFNVPVCPHAGGVGLCEMVQHFSFFDFISVSGSMEGRMIEYVDHLHDHFVDPIRVENARYMLPQLSGMGCEMKKETLIEYAFPDGPVWKKLQQSQQIA